MSHKTPKLMTIYVANNRQILVPAGCYNAVQSEDAKRNSEHTHTSS